MSVSLQVLQAPAPLYSPPRKRTSSFSFPCPAFANANPRPAKAPRTSQMGTSLRRTETLLSVGPSDDGSQAASSSTTPSPSVPSVPYHRSLQYQKDQRNLRRKLAFDNFTSISSSSTRNSSAMPSPQVTPQPNQQSSAPPSNQRSSRSRTPVKLSSSKRSSPTAPTKVILPSTPNGVVTYTYSSTRTSSPLAPVRTPLPDRPIFPRSKAEPDLYKKALLTCMRKQDEGKKLLHMGPRLAFSIWTATKELEKIVEDQQRRDREMDVVMGDPTSPLPSSNAAAPAPPVLTSSWVLVKNDDWEMVDCSA